MWHDPRYDLALIREGSSSIGRLARRARRLDDLRRRLAALLTLGSIAVAVLVSLRSAGH